MALIAEEKPTDYCIEYCIKETKRQVEPYWKAALAKGQTIPVSSEAGTRFFLRSISNEALLKAKKSKDVYNEILLRNGLQDNVRKETKEKIYTVLSKDQRNSWRELVGTEFKFTQQGFGGFGKDKKADPKKDTE